MFKYIKKVIEKKVLTEDEFFNCELCLFSEKSEDEDQVYCKRKSPLLLSINEDRVEFPLLSTDHWCSEGRWCIVYQDKIVKVSFEELVNYVLKTDD